MPFTLSHTVIAIPLYKGYGQFFVLSALIIGTILPDIFSFLPLGISRSFAHSFLGLFCIDMPFGLLVYYLFHRLLSPVIYSLLPLFVQCRINPNLAHGILVNTSFFKIIASLLIGSFTHIIWDAFTHESGIFVLYFTTLESTLFIVDGHEFKLYRLLQHLSSIVGLFIVVMWVKKWGESRERQSTVVFYFPKKLIRMSQVSLIGLPILIGCYYVYLRRNPDMNWLYDLQFSIRHGILASVGFFLINWFLLAILYKFYFRQYKLKVDTALN
ncbi:MAG: DUF4184 family protein [Methylococcales bacterium]|nr:DUF4184 family protein [Methylococcales bacterium]